LQGFNFFGICHRNFSNVTEKATSGEKQRSRKIYGKSRMSKRKYENLRKKGKKNTKEQFALRRKKNRR
jgi:hypothetical protein